MKTTWGRRGRAAYLYRDGRCVARLASKLGGGFTARLLTDKTNQRFTTLADAKAWCLAQARKAS